MNALAQDPEIHRRRARVRAVGRIDLLPEPVRTAIRAAQEATADYGAMLLTIAVAYGGREEIADAVRALLTAFAEQGRSLEEAIGEITPEAIRRHLYVGDIPDPDLIIRTSGEIRLSGFLLRQSAYSEFYFYRRLAGSSKDRLPARYTVVPAETAPVWPMNANHKRLGGVESARMIGTAIRVAIFGVTCRISHW